MVATALVPLSNTAYTAITTAGQSATFKLRGDSAIRMIIATSLPAADATNYVRMSRNDFPAVMAGLDTTDIIYLMADAAGVSAEIVRG